jgi:tetratricopeptide (TPR) repeat protein
MGEPKQALQMINKTLDDYWALNKKTSDTEAFGELGTTWNTLGNIYLQLNKVQKAKQMFKKARACTKKYLGKETPLLRRAYLGLGLVCLKEKKTKKGLRYLTKQLQMCSSYGIKPEKMRPIFEEFQKALAEALQIQGSVLDVQKASQEAALLSERNLGKNHALTENFRQLSSTIDISKVKI